MKEIITEYLKNRCDMDPVLEEKFNEAQMDDCIEYIEEKANDYLHNENGAIEDSIVYGWATEFFTEGQAEVKARLEREREEKRAREEEERKIREEENRKKKEEEKERLAKEKAEKEFQEAQHANGQISLLDFC